MQPELDNKYKVRTEVKRTIDVDNSIPFLRDPRDTSNQSFKKGKFSKTGIFELASPTVGRNLPLSRGAQRKDAKKMRKMREREKGWQGQAVPISKFNSDVHSSVRIPFERI